MPKVPAIAHKSVRLASDQLMRALLHVGQAVPPPGFVQYWTKWRRGLGSHTPQLVRITDADDKHITDAARMYGLTHVLHSRDGVRVGARLDLPADIDPGDPAGLTTLKGVAVTTHGYGVTANQPIAQRDKWTKQGLAALTIRVRGYPGSTFDVPDIAASSAGWITHKIEDAATWILPAAVGDLLAGMSAIRTTCGEHTPMSLHGESFGGALAILAASQFEHPTAIHRLALGVPTFGDWSWRLEQKCGNGLEADIRNLIATGNELKRIVVERLRLFDTVVHAKRIVCPVLMKLAANDPVVPPPTVGAIYNALGSGPGTKWRYIVEHGHTEPLPVDDLRRHARFEALATQFLDPTWDLDGMADYGSELGTLLAPSPEQQSA